MAASSTSSAPGRHLSTMEHLLKDVFRLHKNTISELRGKQAQQQEEMAEVHLQKERYVSHARRLQREVDTLKAEYKHLRELLNASHNKQGESACVSCSHLGKTLTVLQDAYERSLLEKDRVIQSLEERLAAATRTASETSRPREPFVSLKDSTVERSTSDLNPSSRSLEVTSAATTGSPDSTSGSRDRTANRMQSLSPSANQRRPYSPSPNQGIPRSPSGKATPVKRRSDSPSFYQRQSVPPGTGKVSVEPGSLRKAVSDTTVPSETRLGEERQQSSPTSMEHSSVGGAKDLANQTTGLPREPSSADKVGELPREKTGTNISDASLDQKAGTARLSPGERQKDDTPPERESKLHLQRRKKRSRYSEENVASSDVKKHKTSPKFSDPTSEPTTSVLNRALKEALLNPDTMGDGEQGKVPMPSRIYVPETCDPNPNSYGTASRSKRLLPDEAMSVIVPDTLGMDPVLVESSDEDDKDDPSLAVHEASTDGKRGEKKAACNSGREEAWGREEDLGENTTWLVSGESPEKAEVPCRDSPLDDSQGSLPSLHSQALADLTVRSSLKRKERRLVTDGTLSLSHHKASKTEVASAGNVNNSNGSGSSPCIFEEGKTDGDWTNACEPLGKDVDETVFVRREKKSPEEGSSGPDRFASGRFRTTDMLLGKGREISDRSNPSTPGTGSEPQSPLLLQLRRVAARNKEDGTSCGDDPGGGAQVEEPSEERKVREDHPSVASQSLSLLQGNLDIQKGGSHEESGVGEETDAEHGGKSSLEDGERRISSGDVLSESQSKDRKQSSHRQMRHGRSSAKEPLVKSVTATIDLTSTPSLSDFCTSDDDDDDDDEIPNSADSKKSSMSLRSRNRNHSKQSTLSQDSPKSSQASKSRRKGSNQSDSRSSNSSHNDLTLKQATLSQMFDMNSPGQRKSNPAIPAGMKTKCLKPQSSEELLCPKEISSRPKPSPNERSVVKPPSTHAEFSQSTDTLKDESGAKTTPLHRERQRTFKKPPSPHSRRHMKNGASGASLSIGSLDFGETVPSETLSLSQGTKVPSLELATQSSQRSQGHVRGRDLNGSLDPDANLTSMCEDTEGAERVQERSEERGHAGSPVLDSCVHIAEVHGEEGGMESVADVTLDPRFVQAHTSAALPLEDSIPSSYVFSSTAKTVPPSQKAVASVEEEEEEDLVFDDEDQIGASSSIVGQKESLDCSFDRVPRRAAQPDYAYVEVVRKQGERRQLRGTSCQECEKYYRGLGLSEEEIAERIQQCSRHRAAHFQPNTPAHYWSIGIPDTEECKSRGYSQGKRISKPSSFRRRRQLRSLFKSDAGKDADDVCHS